MSQMALLYYSVPNSARQLSCPCVPLCVMVLGSCMNPVIALTGGSEYLSVCFFFFYANDEYL